MYYQASTSAREAFARGDEVLELALPLNQQSGRVSALGGEKSVAAMDTSAELSRGQGGLVLARRLGRVRAELPEASRDKFFLSGQQVAISGAVVGYYVFKRDETKRTERTESSESATPRHVQERPVRTRTPTSEITPLAPLQE